MIQQLVDTQDYRAYLDRRTGDVIIQADPDNGFWNGASLNGHWEVIVRSIKTFAEGPHRVDAKHINHKRGVAQVLQGYTDEEVEAFTEEKLDDILRYYRFSHVLGGMITT